MSKMILSVTIVSIFATTALAQTAGPCGNPYQTTNAEGNQDVKGSIGTPCQVVQGVPAGTCASGTTTPAVDAYCQFSIFYPFNRICCYLTTQVSFATPGPGSTFSTNAPGTTNTPQYLKPKCPNGALSTNTAYTNQPMMCNLTNLVNQNCPYGYTCKKATNVLDVYGTLTNPSDDLGAAFTPNVCCKTTTLNSYGAVFTEAGLSPTFSVLPPLAGIDVVGFVAATAPAVAALSVSLADDVSYVNGQLSGAPTTLTLFSATAAAAATTKYHVLMFDSTNNKDCAFSANNPGTGTTKLTVAWTTAAPITVATVTNNGPSNAPVYAYSATYKPVLYNTATRRYVILVWTTPAELTFAGAGIASTTMLNMNAGTNGDFEPSRASGAAGVFTTVSALVSSTRWSTIFGQPIAGTYFFAKK